MIQKVKSIWKKIGTVGQVFLVLASLALTAIMAFVLLAIVGLYVSFHGDKQQTDNRQTMTPEQLALCHSALQKAENMWTVVPTNAITDASSPDYSDYIVAVAYFDASGDVKVRQLADQVTSVSDPKKEQALAELALGAYSNTKEELPVIDGEQMVGDLGVLLKRPDGSVVFVNVN